MREGRLDCIVITSPTRLPTDCGITSSWVRVGKTQGIGRLARVHEMTKKIKNIDFT